MRRPYVVGNWKMNTDSEEAREILNSLREKVKDIEGVDIGVCPPFPYLMVASELLKGTRIATGAQNMSWEDKGAFTGEVSALMLKDAGCEIVILGHSERRKIFGEGDSLINNKVKKALEKGLRPILCVGETLDERERGKTEEVIESQISGCLEGISRSKIEEITIAYEPVWAIGTGKTATPELAQSVHSFIRRWIENKYDSSSAENIRILYGGSVKPDNAYSLIAMQDIDGALVGGASLSADSFYEIIKEASRV